MKTQSNVNLDGSKIEQTKINKKAESANKREKRIMIITQQGGINSVFCSECGFRIRGKNHLEGAHHNGRVAVCYR